jgi:hypothetical protein
MNDPLERGRREGTKKILTVQNASERESERGKWGIRKDCVSITVAAYTLSLLFAL